MTVIESLDAKVNNGGIEYGLLLPREKPNGLEVDSVTVGFLL